MDTVTSLTLLSALKNTNDTVAWQRFDKRYRPMIGAFARKLGVSESDAQDTAQDVILSFVTAYRDGSYDHDKGRLRGWLFRVAHRRVVDAHREKMRKPEVSRQSQAQALLETVESPESAEQIWDAEWRAFVIAACIEEARRRAEPHNYEAFRLYVIEEIPAGEVAKKLGIKPKAVYEAKSRILKRIRELLPLMDGIW